MEFEIFDGWTNYGDVDWLLQGGKFVKQDTDTCYFVVEVHFSPEDNAKSPFVVHDCYVDLTDTWIDWESVESFADVTNNPEIKCLNALSYYGSSNFGDDKNERYTEDELIEFLINMGIIKEVVQMENKYPDDIMEMAREYNDLNADNTSKDEMINGMSASDMFALVLNWNGFINSADTIVQWVNDIYDIDLDAVSNDMEERKNV